MATGGADLVLPPHPVLIWLPLGLPRAQFLLLLPLPRGSHRLYSPHVRGSAGGGDRRGPSPSHVDLTAYPPPKHADLPSRVLGGADPPPLPLAQILPPQRLARRRRRWRRLQARMMTMTKIRWWLGPTATMMAAVASSDDDDDSGGGFLILRLGFRFFL